MIATVCIGTVLGEPLVVVAHDHDPYVSLTVRGHTVELTRDEARRVGDALRACALTSFDDRFGGGSRASSAGPGGAPC